PIPDGKEFSLNVSTRISSDWQVVRPVSTTGFDASTNPDSGRIPLAVFTTDGSNQIDGPGTITTVFASTVLEEDIPSGAAGATFRVLNARLFPDAATVDLDVGDPSVETGFTLTSVDRVNNLVTISPNPSSAHSAGAILRVTSGTAEFLSERTAAVDDLTSPVQPDVARRLWMGDEIRGDALHTSKETFGERDDLSLRNLKDYVDVLAAQLRELKFGNPRTDINSTAPPSSFPAVPRWYQAGGSIAGAKTAYVTVGDGTNSFGNFNGTDRTAIEAAIASLPAAGGTVYIKAGTYTIDTTSGSISLTGKDIAIIGEPGAVVLDKTAGAFQVFAATGSNASLLRDLTITDSGGSISAVSSSSTGRFSVKHCVIEGLISISGGTVDVEDTLVTAPTGGQCIYVDDVTNTPTVTVTNCTLLNTTDSDPNDVCVLGSGGNATFVGCRLGNTTSRAYRCLWMLPGSSLSHFTFVDCSFAGRRLASVDGGASIRNRASFESCKFDLVADSLDPAFVFEDTDLIQFLGGVCKFTYAGQGATSGSPVSLVSLLGEISNFHVDNFVFDGDSPAADDFVVAIDVPSTTTQATGCKISNTTFFEVSRGIRIDGGAGTLADSDWAITGCTFDWNNNSNLTLVRGVEVSSISSTAPHDLLVANCIFRDCTDTDDARVIDVTAIGSLFARVTIVDNLLSAISSNTSANSTYGIVV
ncbi:MAG: hypothetical protein ACXABY_32340, partial [Candidatus Thorarchaeota archaeon]